MASDYYDVIIIGAGVAGMAAFQRFRDDRKSTRMVAILEAKPSFGGRCVCDRTTPWPFDLGGQFFHQVVPTANNKTFNPLYDIAVAQNSPPWTLSLVSLIPNFYVDGEFREDDSFDFQETVAEYAARVAYAAERARLGDPDKSVAEATAGLDLPWLTLTASMFNLIFDGKAKDVSSLDAWNDMQYATEDEGNPTDHAIREGMAVFIEKLFDPHNMIIEYSTPVSGIDYSDLTSIKVATAHGTLTCGKVIITAPTSTLADGGNGRPAIAFTPELPVEYIDALNNLPMGLVDKIGIALHGDIFGDTADNTFVTQRYNSYSMAMGAARFGGTSPSGMTQMNLIVSEPLAGPMEEEGDRAFQNFAEVFIKDTFGKDQVKHIAATVHSSWRSDPWIRGSYSAARPGCASARTILQKPIKDRIYFAGEAVSTFSHSSLHGAYETGRAAAAAIIGD